MMIEYGLLGKQLSYSLSKEIHETLQAIDYNLIETINLKGFFNDNLFKGINVTIPYKEAVLHFCDYLSEQVIKTQSANTLIRTHLGISAYNTDFDAAMAILKIHLPKDNNAIIAILGNGATSRTIQYALYCLNYQSVRVYARHPKDGEFPWEQLNKDNGINVLINATPVGTYPDTSISPSFDLSRFNHLSWVLDLVYNPLNTSLLLEAKKHRISTMNGLLFLLLQAIKSSQYFFDTTYSLKTIKDTYKSILRKQLNLVLIGPSLSGKTMVSKMLAQQFNKSLIDIDALIENQENMSINDIFSRKGEPYFRNLEHANTLKISVVLNHVIATGAGLITSHEATILLKKNGLFIYLDRDEKNINLSSLGSNRPLLKSVDDWKLLNEKRKPLYLELSDIRIENKGQSFKEIVAEIEVKIDEYLDNQWSKLEFARYS